MAAGLFWHHNPVDLFPWANPGCGLEPAAAPSNVTVVIKPKQSRFPADRKSVSPPSGEDKGQCSQGTGASQVAGFFRCLKFLQ